MVWLGFISLFNGISTFVVYSLPKSFLLSIPKVILVEKQQ